MSSLFLCRDFYQFVRCLDLILTLAVCVHTISLNNESDLLMGERFGPGLHTINNQNPYQGVPVTEGHERYSVIFEPLQNVQTSQSTFKVTSLIDFTPYLEYFCNFERYLAAFKQGIESFESNQIMQEFRRETYKAANSFGEKECTHYASCYGQPLLFKVANAEAQAPAIQRQR